jgi:hypothetical protein
LIIHHLSDKPGTIIFIFPSRQQCLF